MCVFARQTETDINTDTETDTQKKMQMIHKDRDLYTAARDRQRQPERHRERQRQRQTERERDIESDSDREIIILLRNASRFRRCMSKQSACQSCFLVSLHNSFSSNAHITCTFYAYKTVHEGALHHYSEVHVNISAYPQVFLCILLVA